ncbi:hypothetical protein KM043_005932 [Ampulex compressa]|nr:hypothetical protein KM043_005932 [Ampulex compressa]
MSEYEGYEQDLNYITRQSRFVLRILGIWPVFEGKIPLATRILKILTVFVCYSLLLCEVIPSILYYAYSVEPDPKVRFKLFMVLVFSCMAVLKYIGLVFHERDIKGCLGHMREDWRIFGGVSHRRSMIKRARTARQLFLLCGIFMYFSGMFYSTVLPLLTGNIIVDENTTIRPLSSPTYYIFLDEQKSPVYETAFLIQSLSGIVKYTITTTLCGLMAVFVMHACAQLEILAEMIKNIVKKETLKNETFNRSLALAVQHQMRVRRFVHMVEITLQECSLVEIGGCTSVICLLGYCALTAEEVAWASCTLEWYRVSDKKVRSLVLIMTMSNISMQISAGKFIPLSLKSFGDVLKTSGAYFNMLRTMAV